MINKPPNRLSNTNQSSDIIIVDLQHIVKGAEEVNALMNMSNNDILNDNKNESSLSSSKRIDNGKYGNVRLGLLKKRSKTKYRKRQQHKQQREQLQREGNIEERQEFSNDQGHENDKHHKHDEDKGNDDEQMKAKQIKKVNNHQGEYFIEISRDTVLSYKLHENEQRSKELSKIGNLKFSYKYFFLSFVIHITYFFLLGPGIVILNKCFGKYRLGNMMFTTFNTGSVIQHSQYILTVILLCLMLFFDIGAYRPFEFVMILMVVYFRVICISTKYAYLSKVYLHELSSRVFHLDENSNWYMLNKWSELKDDIVEYEIQTSIMKLRIDNITYYFKFLTQGNDYPGLGSVLGNHKNGNNHNDIYGSYERNDNDRQHQVKGDVKHQHQLNNDANDDRHAKPQEAESLTIMRDEPQKQRRIQTYVQVLPQTEGLALSKPQISSRLQQHYHQQAIKHNSTSPAKLNNKRTNSIHSTSELFPINENKNETNQSVDYIRSNGAMILESLKDVEDDNEIKSAKESSRVGSAGGAKRYNISSSSIIINPSGTHTTYNSSRSGNGIGRSIHSLHDDKGASNSGSSKASNEVLTIRKSTINMVMDKIWSYRFYQFTKRFLSKKIEYMYSHVSQDDDDEPHHKQHENHHHRYQYYVSGYEFAKVIIKKARILNVNNRMIFGLILSTIRSLMPFCYRLYFNIPLFGENAVQGVLITTTFLLNLSFYMLNFLIWYQGLIDLKRRLFYLMQITNILYMRNEDDDDDDDNTTTYPMINIFDPVSLKSWGNLRHVLCDFGCRFYANSSFTLAITCIIYMCVLFLLSLKLLGIANLNFDFLIIVVFVYESTVIITLLFCLLYYGSKINQHFDIHKRMLKNNKNAIVELAKLKYVYFERDVTDISNPLLIEGIKYLKMDLEYDKYPEKFQERLEERFQSLIEIINNLMEGLDIDCETSPYQILGFKVNENLMKATAVGLTSLIGAVLQKQLNLI